MSVHQFLFGYQNGHRLIAGSTQLEESLLWTLLRETDRPSTSSKDLEGGIIFGIPLDEELYALCRTWNAREIERPGAVWTHVILLPSNTVSPLRYIDCFCNPGSLSKHEFSAPLDVREFEYDWSNARLDKESAHFLLAIAARPRSKLRVLCESHPIQILKSVGHLWGGLLAGVPFSTSLAKRSVRENKRSVIISDYLSLEFKDIDKFEALSSPNSIQSARIERSWQLLDRDPTKLG